MSNVGDLADDLRKSRAEIDSALKIITDQKTSFSSELQKQGGQFQARFDDVQKVYDAATAGVVREFENLIKPLQQKHGQALEKDIEALEKRLRELLKEAQALVQSQGKAFQGVVEKLIRDSLAELRKGTSQVVDHVGSVYDTEEQSIEVVSTSLTNSVDRAKDLYAQGVEQKIESVKSTTRDMMDDVLASLSSFRQETVRVTRGGQDQIEAVIQSIITNLESTFERSNASLEDTMRDIEGKLAEQHQAKLAKFAEVGKKLHEDLETKLDQHAGELSEGVTQGRSAVDEFRQEEQDKLAGMFDTFRESFSTSAELVDVTTKKEYMTAMAFYQNKLYQTVDGVGKNIQSLYDQSISAFDAAITKLTEARDVFEKNRDSIVQGTLQQVTAVGEEVERSLHEMVGFLQETHESEKKRVEQELDRKIQSFHDSHQQSLEGLTSTLLGVFDTFEQKQKQLATTEVGQVSEFTQACQQQVESSLKEDEQTTHTLFEAFSNDQNQWFDSSAGEVRRQLQEEEGEMIRKLESIAPALTDISEKFDADKKDHFERAISQMESAVQTFKGDIDSWAGDLNTIIAQEISSIHNRVQSRRQESSDALTTKVDEIQKNQEKLGKEFLDQTQTQFRTIDEKFAGAEQGLLSNLHGLSSQFSTQAEAFIQNQQAKQTGILQQNEQFKEASVRFKSLTTDEIAKLTRNIPFQLENVSEATKKLIEKINATIAQLTSPPP